MKSSGRPEAVKGRDFALDDLERRVREGLDALTAQKKIKRRKNSTNPARTFHDGANTERSAILAKVRRMRKQIADSKSELYASPHTAWDDLETWLLSRNERYRKNPGGL